MNLGFRWVFKWMTGISLGLKLVLARADQVYESDDYDIWKLDLKVVISSGLWSDVGEVISWFD